MAKVFKSINDPELIALLVNGAVGVLPTDTVYGLVANISDPEAVNRLYALKHREKKPGTVIAGTVEQLAGLGIDRRKLKQAAAYWPNPLSIILKPAESFAYIHQGVGSSPFRVVSDLELQVFLLAAGPLVTSSANQPGEPPAQTMQEAVDYFGDDVDFYVDGGDRSGYPPSTIARVTDDGLEIIRQGAIVILSEATAPSYLNCPFCLSNGLLEGDIVYQDNHVFITRPLQATFKDAYLIIPKIHAEQLVDLSDLWWRDMKAALEHISELPESYNLSLNYGKPAGQTLSHLHFWLTPRLAGAASAGKGLAPS